MNLHSTKHAARRALMAAAPLAALLATTEPSHAAYDLIAAKSFPRLCPAHVGDGDTEYNGNGPDVRINLHLLRQNGKLDLYAHMHQIETRPDFTEATLTQVLGLAAQADGFFYTHLWRPDANGTYRWQEMGVNPVVDSFEQAYEDQSHSPVTVRPASFWLDEVSSNGDTKGLDIARVRPCTTDEAYLSVKTRPMYVGYLCSASGC